MLLCNIFIVKISYSLLLEQDLMTLLGERIFAHHPPLAVGDLLPVGIFKAAQFYGAKIWYFYIIASRDFGLNKSG